MSRLKLGEERVRRFHRLLSVPMTRFDCGRFCAPQNGGVPFCCDGRQVAPVLYRSEYRWLRGRGRFWKKMPIRNKRDRKLVSDVCDYNLFAECPGVSGCRRSFRALVCRTFPFEPYVDRKGHVQGLVYQEERREDCPLVGLSERVYHARYIANSIRFWRELLSIFPEELELYTKESRKRDRRARAAGKPLKVFRGTRESGQRILTRDACKGYI